MLGQEISILSSEQKCVKVVLSNVSVKVSDLFVEFRLCYSTKNLSVGMCLCTFLTNQSKTVQSQTVVISSQMDFRMLINIKNRFRIITFFFQWLWVFLQIFPPAPHFRSLTLNQGQFIPFFFFSFFHPLNVQPGLVFFFLFFITFLLCYFQSGDSFFKIIPGGFPPPPFKN